MNIRKRLSPNFNSRTDGVAVDALVLHYTGMTSGEAAIERLTDPAHEVSAHYVVDEAGAVTMLVPEDARAWHAGRSMWAGRSGLNDCSIGIEIVNPGHEWGLKPFPDAQIEAVLQLSLDILARWNIPQARVLAHSDIAPLRKQDPGEMFPWRRLAEGGIGLWPAISSRARRRARPSVIEAQRMLAAWGYAVPETGAPGVITQATVAAFQRRYRPERIDGVFDAECGALLAALLAAEQPGAAPPFR